MPRTMFKPPIKVVCPHPVESRYAAHPSEDRPGSCGLFSLCCSLWRRLSEQGNRYRSLRLGDRGGKVGAAAYAAAVVSRDQAKLSGRRTPRGETGQPPDALVGRLASSVLSFRPSKSPAPVLKLAKILCEHPWRAWWVDIGQPAAGPPFPQGH